MGTSLRSSRVTARRAIPNSLDGDDHAAFRAVVDRYLSDERVAREEGQCRAHAAAIVDVLPRGVTVKTIASIGTPYAVRSQCTWPGWPAELEDKLVEWIRDNHSASRSGDRDRTREVAERFDHIIRGLLDARRGAAPAADVTGELLRDLGSLATSVGVIVHGAGPHVCPGRALTLMELRVMLEELLSRTTWIELAPDRPQVRETPPMGGWARVPIVLR